MRILQIISHYVPAHRFGGPQRVAHGLGKALSRAGHEVTVCSTNLADEASDLDVPLDVPVDVEGVTVYYEPTILSRYWGFSPSLWRRAASEIASTDLALVHSHYQFANWVGAYLARKARKPYIIFAHGSLNQYGISRKSKWRKRLYLRLMEHKNLCNALLILFNAPEEKSYSLYDELGATLPSGIDPAEFLDMPEPGYFRGRFPELKDKTTFLFLGRLDFEGKGLDMLIPAFARLVKEQSNAHLILAGPSERQGVEQVRASISEHGIQNSVTMPGLISGADKLSALQDADAFLLPSRSEGMSIALLEALFIGLPVMVTNRVGLCNEIEQMKAGLKVACDSEAIHDGLQQLTDAQTRASARGRGTELILLKYTWDAIAKKLIADVRAETALRASVFELSEPQKYLCRAVADDTDNQEAAQHLVACLSDKAAHDAARANQVAPHVAHALMNAFEADNVSSDWREAHQEIYDRIRAYLAELDHVAAKLAEQGIPLVALKNAGIARGIYPCPGCCPMGDLDVLVEKRHFRRAHQILLDDGYHFEFRSPLEEAELQAAEAGGGAEYWKILPNGEKLWFELQWRPVAGRWIRPDQEPSAEELMSRSVAIPGADVRLLSPEDNLLQVCLHTAKHTYVRAPGFRLHTDVDRIARRQAINWDVFLNRALALRVKTAVYFSLAIPAALFDTPVPEYVLARLRPAAWKRRLITSWLNRAGLFNPNEKKFSRAGYILFNSLLYDDASGLLQGVFPDRAWMRERYGFQSGLLLPYYHLRRVADLVLRRVST